MTLTGGGAMRLAALVLLAAGAWLALREAVNRQFEADRPEAAAWVWPISGNAMLTEAARRITSGSGQVDPVSRALIAGALARVPAAGQPLALAALDASAAGDLPRATRLMEAARDRAPRFALARNWLLNEYIRTARYAEALDEGAALMRLSGPSRPQVYALIAAMAGRPETAPAVQSALAAGPDWAVPYNQWLAAQAQAAPPE